MPPLKPGQVKQECLWGGRRKIELLDLRNCEFAQLSGIPRGKDAFGEERENKTESSVKLCVFSEQLCEIAICCPLSAFRCQDKIPRGHAFTFVTAGRS